MKARASDHYKELKPRSATRKRPPPGRDRAGPSTRLPGLRWVAAPLAVLATVVGALVVGSLQGQVASANSQHSGYRAGGLAMSVVTMLFMNDNMSPDGSGKPTKGYQMPSSEMPGMQPVGDNRLRVEVNVSNISSAVQQYSTTDFRLAGPGGKTWQVNGQEHSDVPASADLEPGFGTIYDFYFDIPAKSSHHLTLIWSRDGTTVSIPVNVSPPAGGMQM